MPSLSIRVPNLSRRLQHHSGVIVMHHIVYHIDYHILLPLAER